MAILLFFLYFVLKHALSKPNYVDKVKFENNIVTVYLNTDKELYCILSNKEPNIDDKWIESKKEKCTLKYIEDSNLYIKYEDKITNYTDKNSYFEIKNEDTLYVALNGSYNYYNYLIGDANNINNKYDNKIIKIDDNGIIKGLNEGKTTIETKINDKNYNKTVIVTKLITKRSSDGYDYKKSYLACNKYSEEENIELDNILENRINNVGYKTRAAAVEAARFLTLDFPYRINYFYENGRQTTNKVDGEGRYYHVGLYLYKSKYTDLTGSTTLKNKGTWGCSIYSYPAKRNIDNGLDCSGFVSWVLLNAGFDVKDVGAGWSDSLDLTDYGEVVKINNELIDSDRIRVGDLLHSEKAGGHIGIIVGMDESYYYIAQALWFDEIGVIVTKAKRNELKDEFPHAVLMDKYYINDGILTDMW